GRVSDVVARVDDDEFALLLPDTNDQGVRRMFERLQSTIADTPPRWIGSGRSLKLCGGYALAADAPSRTEVTELFDQAHHALYSHRTTWSEIPLHRFESPTLSS